MAWVIGGKHFGQYTYEHWFDDYTKMHGDFIMLRDVIVAQLNYNSLVNVEMNNFIKTLNKEEWDKSLGGYYPSVHSLCSHVYIADFSWVKRFKNLRSFLVLDDPVFRESYSFSETIFENMEEYLSKRPVLDSLLLSFADEISSDDLCETLKYTDFRGTPLERNVGICILHFINHQIHTRGMISLYLEMLGRENDFSSFVRYMK